MADNIEKVKISELPLQDGPLDGFFVIGSKEVNGSLVSRKADLKFVDEIKKSHVDLKKEVDGYVSQHVTLSQSEYDKLVDEGKVDPNKDYYIYEDE